MKDFVEPSTVAETLRIERRVVLALVKANLVRWTVTEQRCLRVSLADCACALRGAA